MRFPLGPNARLRVSAPRRGPTIKRGRSAQDASTPWEFIQAVKGKFGILTWDLAATAFNTRVRNDAGPVDPWFSESQNSLVQEWHKLNGLLWLNPPYANITPWARKCAQEAKLGAEILLLVPASIGANWYWDWVEPVAQVYSVGRMVFDDCYDDDGNLITTPYPKDLILCHYSDAAPERMERWLWRG